MYRFLAMLCELGGLLDSIRHTRVHVLIVVMVWFGLNLFFPDNQVRADRASCDQQNLPSLLMG